MHAQNTHTPKKDPYRFCKPQPHTRRQPVTASGSQHKEQSRERELQPKNTLSAFLSLRSDRRATVYRLHRQPDSERRRPAPPSPLPLFHLLPTSHRREGGQGWSKKETEGGSPPVCPSDLINGPLPLRDNRASLLPFAADPCHTHTNITESI